jgi:hypothetical protein
LEISVARIVDSSGIAADPFVAIGRVLGSMVVRARQLGGLHIGKDLDGLSGAA